MITNGYEAYEEYNEVDDNYGVEETRDSNEQGDNEDSSVSWHYSWREFWKFIN